MKEHLTEALRYWEKRRFLYNAILAVVTVSYFIRGYPHSRTALTVDFFLWLFVLAVAANIVYCAAYIPDVAAQASGFRETWRRYRWILFVIGVVLAAIFTRWIVLGLFGWGV